MKVIFLKDVSRYGRRDEIKEVSDGYALNFLIPNKMAAKVTPELLTKIEAEKARDAAVKQAENNALVEIVRQLQKAPITIPASVNDKGHLFKAIHESDIVETIKKVIGKDFPVSTIKTDGHIKEAGEHKVVAHIGGSEYVFKINILRA